jgi:SAM-dependent methyltransferase
MLPRSASSPAPDAAACPICGAATIDIGRTVHGPRPAIAGVPVDLGDAAGRLRACPACDLRFKHPFVPDSVLMDCYAASPEDNWEHAPDPRRRRFDDLAATLRAHAPGRRVLDVGCSNAALLAFVGADFDRFGLEPGREASRVAESRGVRMLGATLADLEPGARFDAILAVDVLEHLTDPPAFIAAVARHLEPGGVFIGLTGDHAAWGWRLQGAAYWYAALPEHQVFLTRRTVERLAADHGFEVAAFRRTSHARHSVGRTIRDAVRGTVAGLVRRLGFRRGRPGPGWLPARDHMLFVLRRTAERTSS